MKKVIFLFIIPIFFYACETTSTTADAWTTFTKCATNNCVKEALAVKDAFLKNPQQVLTAFQATYEKGEDHVIGWLYILRDSVLINPKMGTIEERLAMQQSLISAAKPFEKDAKVHEMAKSVMDELGVVDVKAGKINDPMVATTPTFCYQFDHQGEHIKCQLLSAANGEFSGYYSWYIDEKDGAYGVLKGKNFFSDTLIADHTYMQEGSVASEEIIFMKKGDNLIQLVGDLMDKGGKMVVKDRRKLKAGNTLNKVDCGKVEKDFDAIKNMEKDKVFMYPDLVLTEKQAKVAEKLIGEWQSKDDPKAGIKMENGNFTFLYDGKATDAPMRYIYYPSCPKDCNPRDKLSCLKIIGQDDVCYSIIFADGKTLHISQIGGTGNTNRYVKK